MPFLQYHTKVKIIFDYLFVRVKNSAYLGEKKILKNFDPFKRLFQPVLFERLDHSFRQIL